jgi:hypothetical protein
MYFHTAFTAALLLGTAAARRMYVTDIGHQDASVTLGDRLAVLACQGLMNRNNGSTGEEETAVFTIKESWDLLWLETAQEQDPGWELLTIPSSEFLSEVCAQQNFPKLLYSKELHHEIIPQLITIAGVLDAVPLDVGTAMDQIPAWIDHEVAFDAAATFPQVSELLATEYVFDTYGHLTTGVAMMNPGWRQPDDMHPIDHELVADPRIGLADYIIKERVFNFFLYTGCVPLTEEHALMRRMMTDPSMSWKKPVEVYGYNDAVHFFGSIFEAETNCIAEHNMGQVASSDINNFSFFNRRPSITSPAELEGYLGALLQTRQDIADGKLVYDPTTTYMTLIIGDGDNIHFMKTGRRGWMEERVQHCQETETGRCSFPLAFSMSPHLVHLAPDWLHWYYERVNATGQDVMVLPPSGHLYAYPGMMDDTTQTSFMESTNRDCELLSARGTVHWEWFYGWQTVFNTYFPKYVGNSSCITSFFATNVPYNFPTNVIWDDHYRALDGEIFVFKPREWRGTNADGAPPFSGQNYLTEEEMAAEISGYKPGSVSHLYLTSDGGMNLPTIYTMVGLLEDHVKIVNHEELTEMARQRTASLNT